ncbi:hypothetical protein ABZP36_016469 [Zizania latifolia]
MVKYIGMVWIHCTPKYRSYSGCTPDASYPVDASPSFLCFWASIEPNFHDLYLNFFDKDNSEALNKEMVKATYENCKVLLQSDLIKSCSEERSLLKNLGSWLGKFTIGRNQTLPHYEQRKLTPKFLQ